MGFPAPQAVGAKRLEGTLQNWLRLSKLGALTIRGLSLQHRKLVRPFGKEPKTSRKLGVGLKGVICSKTTSAVMLTESLDALIKRHELSLVMGTEKASLETSVG